jgi:putative peptide zinc metalloprotease protein
LVLFAVSVCTAVAVLAAPAHADGGNREDRNGNGTNSAIAVNTKDGSSLFKFAFDMRTVADGVVDQTNAAIAYASCNACKTVAVAIQIVFVTQAASVQTPTNVALAVNDQCTGCQTLATAYQFIVPTDGPVHFTKDGRKGLRYIITQVRALGRSELDVFEIQSRIDGLMKQLQAILSTQLVRGPPEGDEHQNDGNEPSPTTDATSPTSTSSATVAPTTTTTADANGTTTTTAGTTASSSSTSTP